MISSTHKLIISAGTLLRLSSQEYHQLQVQDTLELHHLMFRPRSGREYVTGQVTCKNTGEGIVVGKCVGIDLHHMTFELSFGLN